MELNYKTEARILVIDLLMFEVNNNNKEEHQKLLKIAKTHIRIMNAKLYHLISEKKNKTKNDIKRMKDLQGISDAAYDLTLDDIYNI